MLIKPTIVQLGSASLNKILGLFITAYFYRIYTLEEIGEYFLLISLFSIFVAIQQIGSDKPLIKYNLKSQKKNEYQIIKTRILISLILTPILFYISNNLFDSITYFGTTLLLFALIFNSLTLEYLLIAKKKFLGLSIIQFFTQFIVFVFFGLCLYFNLKPDIIFYQFLPSVLLTILIFTQVKKIITINLKKIFFSKIVSLNYFKENKIIITGILFVSAIMVLDFLLAENILEDFELGLISGLYRYSMLSYGFLMIISKILFSFSINTSNSKKFDFMSKQLMFKFNIVSVLILLLFLFPYLKYIMDLDQVNFILQPAVIITLSTLFMPGFFLELNKIQSTDKKKSFNFFIIFITITIILYYIGGLYFASLFTETISYNFLSYIFLLKWIFLNFGITYVRKKSNIR